MSVLLLLHAIQRILFTVRHVLPFLRDLWAFELSRRLDATMAVMGRVDAYVRLCNSATILLTNKRVSESVYNSQSRSRPAVSCFSFDWLPRVVRSTSKHAAGALFRDG